jgi:hypothetical protein
VILPFGILKRAWQQRPLFRYHTLNAPDHDNDRTYAACRRMATTLRSTIDTEFRARPPTIRAVRGADGFARGSVVIDALAPDIDPSRFLR